MSNSSSKIDFEDLSPDDKQLFVKIQREFLPSEDNAGVPLSYGFKTFIKRMELVEEAFHRRKRLDKGIK